MNDDLNLHHQMSGCRRGCLCYCNQLMTDIGVEYGGLEPPQRFYKGGSVPAEILVNLIAVTILANPETLDVTEKKTFIHIVSLLYS